MPATSFQIRTWRVSRRKRPSTTTVMIAVALVTVVVGGRFLQESRHVRIWDDVAGAEVEPEPVPS